MFKKTVMLAAIAYSASLFGSIQEITTYDEFDAAVKQHDSGLVAVVFYDENNQVSKDMAPEWEKVAAEYTQLKFVKVLFSRTSELVMRIGFGRLLRPFTVLFYRNGKWIGRMNAVKADAVKAYLDRLTQPTQPH